MRKVKYAVGVSLDGYIAAPDGSVDWLNRATAKARAKGKGEDFGMGALFKSIDTVLLGRKTYDSALKMGMGKNSFPGMKTYILSRTLPPGARDGVEFASDAVALIARLKRQPGKDIWLCGGGELARAVLEAKALDEVTLGITPVLLGAGRLTFPPGFPETEVELVEVKQYKGGVASLTYKVIYAPAAAARPSSKRRPPRSRCAHKRKSKKAPKRTHR